MPDSAPTGLPATGSHGALCGWVREHLPTFGAAPVTLLLALFHLGLFEAVWLARGEEGVASLIDAVALSHERVWSGEWWRLLTSGMAHFGWDHLLWNVLGLLVLGVRLERRIGSAALALLHLVSALAASATELAFATSVVVGASGSVFGLLGVLLAQPLHDRRSAARGLSLGWLLAAAYASSALVGDQARPDVSFTGHAGGLVGGLLFAIVLRWWRARVERLRAPWRESAAILLGAAGLMASLAPNVRWTLGWHWTHAQRAGQWDDHERAARHWRAIEAAADPHSKVEAHALFDAARYWYFRRDYSVARALLADVAPTLDDARGYLVLGHLQARVEPRDERGALASFRKSLELDPCRPATLHAMAWLELHPRDSSLFQPFRARALARGAVVEDGGRASRYLRTLARAHLHCGDTAEAIRHMELALRRNPEDRAEYERELAGMRGS